MASDRSHNPRGGATMKVHARCRRAESAVRVAGCDRADRSQARATSPPLPLYTKGVGMNLRRILAGSVPAAALMLTSQGASAFGMMEVGDWQVEFGGNVNAYLTQANCDPGDG